MKAQLLTGIRQMEMRLLPDPVIEKDDQVLLKVETVGLCGSDVHYYETGRIGSQVVQFASGGFILGHEFAATVLQVGSAVTKLRASDTVVVDPAVVCHHCDQCLAGRENTCRNLKFLGCPGQLQGCLAEYIVMPEDCCYRIDHAAGLEKAVLCEPFAIGIYALQQSQASSDSAIAILGSGPIGLSCLAAAKISGVDKIYVTDKIDSRLTAARNAGASWTGNPDNGDIVADITRRQTLGLDIVFECAGRQDTIDQAVELLRPSGRLMLIGIPRTERISLAIDKIRRKEITIINVRRQNRCTAKAVDLVSSGTADIGFMITHRFDFDKTQQAFNLVAGYEDGVIKALITMGK